MNWRIFTSVALALFMSLPATALASHMGEYTYSPFEHDDQGSSNEPDRTSTTVLTGSVLTQRVIDYNLDYTAEPDSATPAGKVLAPGCTANDGRHVNGECGLWTVGFTQPTAGVTLVERHTQGVQSGPGPGLTGKGAATVRLLDARIDYDVPTAAAGSHFIDFNKKLEDRGLSGTFGGPTIIPGSLALWVWYGTFSDKNGNGVLDHLGHPDDSGNIFDDNEFVWGGECTQFDGSPVPPGISYCVPDPAGSNPKVLEFVFPGNSHAYCGGFIDPIAATCSVTPADRPGGQVIGFADALLPNFLTVGPAGVSVGSGCSTHFFTDFDTGCQSDLRRADYNDENGFGDPLLGTQTSVAPDGKFHDRGGDPTTNVRHIVYGDGWAVFFYDQGLLVNTVFTTVVGCPQNPASPNTVDLQQCRFVDIDKYNAANPATDALLQGTVKPAARGQWQLFRDSFVPVQATVSTIQNRAEVYAATQGPLQGELGDRLNDPGFAREPNQGLTSIAGGAQDSYPGAVRGSCTGTGASERTFRGYCNSYAGYAAGPRAWTDLIPQRVAMFFVPISATPGGQCLQCVSGATIGIPFAGEPIPLHPFPRDAGNHDRTLGPGIYNWFGAAGLWQDKPQTWLEQFLDITTGQVQAIPHTNARDGWVGNVVNATGTFYYLGYTNQNCATDQGAGAHTFAECNPYLDGNIQNPQQAGDQFHGEWTGKRCESTVGGVPNIRVSFYPKGGIWTVPVFRWVQHQNGFAIIDPAGPTPLHGLVLEERTGSTGPISITASCFASAESGFFAVNDLLVLPQGNLGLDVATVLTTTIPTSGGARESVTDVDYYFGWGT